MAVGGTIFPADIPQLRSEGITHVCDVTSADDFLFLAPPDFNVLWLNTQDDGASKVEFYEKIPAWFLAAWVHPGYKFLFHCEGGNNRGPSAAYTALRCLSYTSNEALAIVHRRPIHPDYVRYRGDGDQALRNLGYPLTD